MKGQAAEPLALTIQRARRWLADQPRDVQQTFEARARERMVADGNLRYGDEPDKQLLKRYIRVEAVLHLLRQAS